MTREHPPEPDDPTGERGFVPTLIATAGWYATAAIVYIVWMIGFAGDGCDGEACGRPARIVQGLSGALPWAFPSLALSLLIAVLLRLPAVGWRASSTAIASAVLGAGLTTAILRSVGYDIG